MRRRARKILPPSRRFQSTHPLRGATILSMSAEGICQHFNPRTPCGVRRLVAYRNRPTHNFNPRTPCGVRLTGPALPSRALLFQSTHPLRGATPPRSPGSAAMSNFNPRTPCGVRRHCLHISTFMGGISIHAPLAGCDAYIRMLIAQDAISIHAPLAGCDPKRANGITGL